MTGGLLCSSYNRLLLASAIPPHATAGGFNIDMHAARQMQHHAHDLVTLFDHCFHQKCNTRLVGGAPEPIYLPADERVGYHRVCFTQDYFASALHEVAHWCIAGSLRRKQVDYGYWYAPDGRDAVQQRAFEFVEVKPQALEWIFSEACGFKFRVSADNLTEAVGASESFIANIAKQAQKYCTDGIAGRPQRFIIALAEYYGVTKPLNRSRFDVKRLG